MGGLLIFAILSVLTLLAGGDTGGDVAVGAVMVFSVGIRDDGILAGIPCIGRR